MMGSAVCRRGRHCAFVVELGVLGVRRGRSQFPHAASVYDALELRDGAIALGSGVVREHTAARDVRKAHA